jgi:hypothetical protein
MVRNTLAWLELSYVEYVHETAHFVAVKQQKDLTVCKWIQERINKYKEL